MADRNLILCVGTTPTVQRSMIFERVEIDAVNRAVEVSDYASGKSPNVARVLHTLGANLIEVGFVGGDRGKFLQHDLEQAGIRCEFVKTHTPTRLCTTVIDRSAGVATELVEESSPIEPAAWEELDRRLAALLPAAGICVFSGSLPPAAPQDFYARWAQSAADHGIRFILDTRGEPLRLALGCRGLIAKLNREELTATLGRPLASAVAVRDAAREILSPGGATVITLGKDGAIACDATSAWHVVPPEVTAISAVGSGDAFAAGLALELSRGKPLRDALILAAACGAANALTALAGHLGASDVERICGQVRVGVI